MTFDFDKNIISSPDYNLFIMKPGQSTALDLIGMNTYDKDGKLKKTYISFNPPVFYNIPFLINRTGSSSAGRKYCWLR